MANIKSVEKRARQAETRAARNKSIRSACKTRIKKVRASITAADKATALASYSTMSSELDKAVKKGVLHRNTASRHKSRLQKAIAKIA